MSSNSPLPSTSLEEIKKGLMLPPPVPIKDNKGDGVGIPGPPPRMTRLPSLKQLSDHLHYTPQSSSSSQFPNILSTPGQSPSTSTTIPATPPSLRIATNSLNQTPGGSTGYSQQSPLIAPSPSSRLRLPASAMMRSLSSGPLPSLSSTSMTVSTSSSSNNGIITPGILGGSFETLHSPNWSSRSANHSSMNTNDIFDNSLSSSSQNTPKQSPITGMTGSGNGTGTPLTATAINSFITREGAPAMSRTSSSNSYIQGYSNVPSLDQIRRRISISLVKESSSHAQGQGQSQGQYTPKTDAITSNNVGVPSILSAGIIDSPNGTYEMNTTGLASANVNANTPKPQKVEVQSPPETASLTSSSSNGSDLANHKKKEHPLTHAWTLFFDSKTYKPDTTSVPKKEDGSVLADYEMTLLTVGKFDTVEGFARHLNNIRLPSLLNKNSNYHMFKNGIRPMWEDPANANGGKWVILFRSSPPTLDVAWANLTMALVGEMLDEEDEVCGIVASNRPKIDRIQIWTRSRNDHEKINKLGRKILEVMALEGRDRESMSMEYQYNASNSHPPAGLFLHIPFPTTIRTPASTPGRLSANGPVGLGIGLTSSASPKPQGTNSFAGSGGGRSPTNPTFTFATPPTNTGGQTLELPSTNGSGTGTFRSRLGSGSGLNAFAGPMGGMGIARMGSNGGNSNSNSPSPSPSPTPTPRALKS
ncbi:uncharacterized protein IL334_006250 [Kwoniella shivajii]|uniref:Translation initiation factor 4E n=1 Tax=Kwoniella shivajii TaxID=564305 RepID=A0ABZ1D5E6_9TREE|nr:hypothetical protein IL334_006250 [Kwoniella shivajii]